MITPNVKIDFAIITALQIELDAVLSKLGHYQSVGTKTDSLPFYYAEIGRTQVLVTRSGPGNTSAAIAGNTVLERFHPDHLLMVGIAAGFQGKVELGDVVVAEACYYDGPGKETSEGKLPAPRQLPTGAFLSARSKDYNALDWKENIQVQSPGGSSQPSVHHGVIVSSETVVGNPERMASLLATHRKCRALAMEGYGVAEAAWHNRIDFLEIRGICDFGDGNKNDDWHEYAAHAAAAYAVGLLRYIEPIISTKSATAWEEQPIFLENHSSPPVSQAPPLTAEERRDLPKLLKAVRYIWIEGQLEDYSLHVHQRPLIALEKQATPEHVERYRDRLLARPERESQILPADKAISAVFQEVRNFLLILGDPGAGKTVTLLELARDLIASAQNDTSQPIPVIFNLSTWVESQKKGLFGWLVEQFDLWYRIPKKASAAWLQQQRLFLLLDGLDEVKAKFRASCVAAINEFVEKYQPPGVVVCCRLEEYVALGDMRLQLEGAVCLQPFTEAQIATYLDQAHLTNVQAVIAQDENLRELAKTPLLLDVISVAYENVTAEEVNHSATETLETRQQQLFDRYLDKMFERKAVKKDIQASLLDKLKWLARKMQQHGEQVFFIEHLRPSYLGSQIQEKFFQYLFGIGMAAFMGLLVFIIGKRTIFVLISSGSGVLWLWASVVAVMMIGTFWFSIKHSVPEAIRWSWQGAINRRILWGCVIGIPAGFFLVYQGTFNIGNVGVWLQNRVGLNDKVLLILGGMLLFGWLGFFVGGVTQGQLPDTLKFSPNQGIHQAIKNLGLVILPFSAGVGVFFTVQDSSLYNGLTMGMIALLLGGLLFGGLVPIIQHYYVRFLLFASHRLPFRPVTFLNQATQLFLLRRVGGGYKFIHRLVLDHLAKKFDLAKEQQAVKKVIALFVSSLLVIMFISWMMVSLLFKGIANFDYGYDYRTLGVPWWLMLLKAEEGYAEDQNVLGQMYQYGQVVARDEAMAEKWYQRAVEQGNAWGHGNLCWLYITQHKLEEANVTCQRGYELFPNNPLILIDLGHLQFLKGNYQQARTYYEEALVKCTNCFRLDSWIISNLESFITKNWHPEEAKRLIACVKEKAEALALEREFEPNPREFKPNPEDLRTHTIRLVK
jgi:nucleoside phosphorylase/DNA polymerase III delta prime subunit